MNQKNFIIKGNIIYSKNKTELEIKEQAYLICENGKCAGVFEVLPEQYQNLSYMDYQDCLIIPGMTDLHVHAPQYSYRGLGMDMELIDWLNAHAFPEESKFSDLEYARKAYRIFVHDLLNCTTTTRACIFGTLHKEATLELMELLEDAGMHAYVGKVNMDRNSPDILREESAEDASKITEQWILEAERFENVRQILTPRFIPSCSDELMREISRLQKKYELPMQSHLSENLGEIAWVQELCPESKFYGDAYDQFELFGGDCPTIMAHCVHSGEEEVELMKANNVFVAHCPQSNTNIASGIAPVRRYLEKDLKMGLGSDVAGGANLSIMRAMTDAIQCSKLRWRMYDQSQAPLKFEEAFYLATKGGGECFGKVGSFEEGYEFDAVVLSDENLPHPQEISTKERLERIAYLGDDRNVLHKYIAGKSVK